MAEDPVVELECDDLNPYETLELKKKYLPH